MLLAHHCVAMLVHLNVAHVSTIVDSIAVMDVRIRVDVVVMTHVEIIVLCNVN